MGAGSRLGEQLAVLGIHTPMWPEEPEGPEARGDWIQRGLAYAEGLRLWRAQLRNAPESTHAVVGLLLRHLEQNNQLPPWDQVVMALVGPDVLQQWDWKRWDKLETLLESLHLTDSQQLGISLALTQGQQIGLAATGLSKALRNRSTAFSSDLTEILALFIAQADTSWHVHEAGTGTASWVIAVDMHLQLTQLLHQSLEQHHKVAGPAQNFIAGLQRISASTAPVDLWAGLSRTKAEQLALTGQAQEAVQCLAPELPSWLDPQERMAHANVLIIQLLIQHGRWEEAERLHTTAMEGLETRHQDTGASIAVQRQVVLEGLRAALKLAGVDRTAELASELGSRSQLRMARLLRHPGRPLVRTVHHLACTGGTVISKCLAAMPRIALVSEVNPLNRVGSTFEPTNPLLLLERSYRDLTLEEIQEDFLSRMAQAEKICRNDGMNLVIRDHSHTDFCMGEAPRGLTPICDFLADYYDLVSVVTVRHPLDSYLGMVAQGWQIQFTPSTLEEYSRRYLAFLDRYRELPLRRYEEFCAGPEAFMQDLCELLELEYSPRFLERFGSIKLSGDSGRSFNSEITPRPRRVIPEEIQVEVASSASYGLLLERLGYNS